MRCEGGGVLLARRWTHCSWPTLGSGHPRPAKAMGFVSVIVCLDKDSDNLLANRLGSAYRLAKGDLYVLDSLPEHEQLLVQLASLLQGIGGALLPSKERARQLLPARPEVRELVNLLSILASRPVVQGEAAKTLGEAAKIREVGAAGSSGSVGRSMIT